MRKYIILFSVLLVGALYATNYQWVTHGNSGAEYTGYASTTTDTTNAVSLDGEYVYMYTFYDLESSTTMTLEIDVLAKDKTGQYYVIKNNSAGVSAATASGIYKYKFRMPDTVDVATNSVYLKRVVTVTGDSVTLSHKVVGWD